MDQIRYTCVASWLMGSLLSHGIRTPFDIVEVVQFIDTVFMPHKGNVNGFRTSEDESDWGVSVRSATKTIPRLLDKVAPDLCFHHVPFRAIAFDLFDEFFYDVIRTGAAVGVGFDPSKLITKFRSTRHVARATPTEQRSLVSLDDSRDFHARVTWEELERAVAAVDDGYWLLARRGSLHFKYALFS